MFPDRGVEREGSEAPAGKRVGDISSPGPDRKQTKTLNPQTGNKFDSPAAAGATEKKWRLWPQL